jgi:hypothetical protein
MTCPLSIQCLWWADKRNSALGAGHTRHSALPRRRSRNFEPTEKQRDDLNVDAVFARFKTIGGKKQDDEE